MALQRVVRADRAAMALAARSYGTNRWSWAKPATTLVLMPASVSAWLTAAVSPTASREEWTCNVIHAATNSYGKASASACC